MCIHRMVRCGKLESVCNLAMRIFSVGQYVHETPCGTSHTRAALRRLLVTVGRITFAPAQSVSVTMSSPKRRIETDVMKL